MQPITEASNEITDNIDIASPSGKYYIPFYPVQKCCNIIKRATSRENLSSVFATSWDSNRHTQLMWLAKVLKFRL